MKYFVPGVNVKVLGKVIHCLAKVGDDVAIDMDPDSLTVRTVNISRSAFATYTFGSSFFTNIDMAQEDRGDEEGSSCKVMVRSLLLAFRSLSNLDRTVDSCVLQMDNQNCKFLVTFHCRHAVSKSYSLGMLEDDNMRAVYDINTCTNKWTVDSKVIQEANGNFLANQEEVTMQVTADLFNIKNYNDSLDERTHVNTEFSMQPREFECFQINEDTNVTFCLKEFRSLLLFSEYLNVPISVNFSVGGHPLVFSASQGDFLSSTYVLASMADDGSSQPAVKTPQPVKKRVQKSDFPPPLVHHSTQLDVSGAARPSQTICTPDLSTIPSASVPHPHNFDNSIILHEEETVEASPPAKKKNFFFRRCFDATWNPNRVDGKDKVLAPDSDEEN